MHAVFLDGVFHEDAKGEVVFHALPRLETAEVARVLEDATKRITGYLRRRGLLSDDLGEDGGGLAAPEGDESAALAELASTAASGMTPPAGPSWKRGALSALTHARDFERHLSVGRAGFTLHAATRVGAMDERGREALLKYILRPPVAQERITQGPEGLVRIALKKSFSDGTFAIDLDPLSLLTRLCASVPPPRFHTTRYAGVLASASKLRSRIMPNADPVPSASESNAEEQGRERRARRCRYRPWAELMMRTFKLDVLCCPRCSGRLRLVALMTEPKEIRRYLRALGEATEAPERSAARGPPYWRSRALRRRAGAVDAA